MSTLDRLNLRPQEKRLVIGVGIFVFVLLNYFLVWPRFDDLNTHKSAMVRSRKKLAEYKAEVDKMPAYQLQLAKLEEGNPLVESAEQALLLIRRVQEQAARSGVTLASQRPVPRVNIKTNAFFEEEGLAISFTAGDKELVDFLVTLGGDNSMIRVRDMDLKPDPSRSQLVCNLTLFASYPKASARSTPPPAKVNAPPPAKPAAPPAKPAAR